MTAAHVAAARAVGRVVRHGAWSNVVTRVEAERSGARVSVVQALTLPVLRALPSIDRAIAAAAGRSLEAIDSDVLDGLRVTAAEIMDGRRPVAVVVDAGVEAIGSGKPRATGFANAVLRRLASDPPAVETLADIGVPGFVDDALRHVLDPGEVDRFWWASQSPAAVGIRADAAPVGATPVPGIPGAWLLEPGRPPSGSVVQDPASVAVGNAVDVPSGALVAELAAAPGGKSRHLRERAGPTGRVVALDRNRRRVRDASRRVPDVAWVVADGTRPPLPDAAFDAVLVDAPCSGLGTLRRRPEIRFRVSPGEVGRLAATQRRLLEAALRLVRPGGRVVYSVCTVVPAETIDVVAGLGAEPPKGPPGRVFGDGLLLAPHIGPTDGMFIAVLDR